MAGLSRYEKGALGLTAAFALLMAGSFLAEQSAPASYRVEVAQNVQTEEMENVPDSSAEAERPETLMEGEVIDLNSADVYDLQRLPGIGEKKAQAIVAYREEHGPFHSVEELAQVSGIGEKTVAGLAQYAAADGN